MRIPLDQLVDGGLKISADTTDTWVVAAASSLRGTPGEPVTDPHADEPPETAKVVLTLERLGDQVSVHGQTALQLLRGCDRCGGSVRMSISGEVKTQYNPPGDLLADTDHGLEEDELDVGWHDGLAIDLCSVLTEQLTLLTPDRVRCGDPGVVPLNGGGACLLPEGVVEESAEDGPRQPNPFAGLLIPE